MLSGGSNGEGLYMESTQGCCRSTPVLPRVGVCPQPAPCFWRLFVTVTVGTACVLGMLTVHCATSHSTMPRLHAQSGCAGSCSLNDALIQVVGQSGLA
jgi:hypothetical protein